MGEQVVGQCGRFPLPLVRPTSPAGLDGGRVDGWLLLGGCCWVTVAGLLWLGGCGWVAVAGRHERGARLGGGMSCSWGFRQHSMLQ